MKFIEIMFFQKELHSDQNGNKRQINLEMVGYVNKKMAYVSEHSNNVDNPTYLRGEKTQNL